MIRTYIKKEWMVLCEDGKDPLCTWVATHPFSAVGSAFGFGFVLVQRCSRFDWIMLVPNKSLYFVCSFVNNFLARVVPDLP